MPKLFRKTNYFYGILKKLIVICYFNIFLSIRNKLNYCKNEAAGRMVKIGWIKKVLCSMFILLSFQIGVYWIKNNNRNNPFKLNAENLVSLKSKLLPTMIVYAKDDIGNSKIEITEVPVRMENIYTRINGYVRNSMSDLSEILNNWFDFFLNQEDLTSRLNAIPNNAFPADSGPKEKPHEGVLLVPIGNKQDEQALKEKLKGIISDDFKLEKVEDEGFGIIKPVFKNTPGNNQNYLFMMVPVIPEPTAN
jgi:hypothetical protein